MADRYYGIQFKCKTAQHGEQVRYISYGLVKDGELLDADISRVKSEMVDVSTRNGHGIEILDFNKSQEYSKEEWDQLINSGNGPTK